MIKVIVCGLMPTFVVDCDKTPDGATRVLRRTARGDAKFASAGPRQWNHLAFAIEGLKG